MSNQAPWSVKGIDPRAREAAREAARRQGLTIGEWLNQAILANEDALDDARHDHRSATMGQDSRDERLSSALQQLTERVDVNDRRNALAMLGMDRTLSAVAARVERTETESRNENARVTDLLDELRDAQSVLLEQMKQIDASELPAAQAERIGGVETDLRALSARALEAEQATSAALVRLDGAMVALDAKISDAVSTERLDKHAEEMRERLEANLDTMAHDVASMIAEARADIAGQIVAALGGLQPEEMNAALGDMSKRLTAAEKRHTQTIEAVSIEIKRLSESMDRRLRTVEARNDDGGSAELREEISSLSRSLEHRLGEMEAREAAAFSRMGEEVGRIAERLDVRVATAEGRSAEAIDKVGEQLALMSERLSAKQDKFATEVAERIVQSEERQSGRLSQALAAISTRLNAIESNTAEAISPVSTAMDTFAARLAAIEARAGVPVTLPEAEPSEEPAYLEAPVVHADPSADLRSQLSSRFALEHEQDLHARYTRHEDDPQPAEPAVSGEQVSDEKETVFLEDIEEEFSRREEDPSQAPQYELPPQAPRGFDDPFADIESAPPQDEDEDDLLWSTGPRAGSTIAESGESASMTSAAPLAFEDEQQDDELSDEALAAFAPQAYQIEEPPLPRNDDSELDEFDSSDALMQTPVVERVLSEEEEIERTMFDSGLDLDAPAPKDDYLSAARRAAQASAQAPKKGVVAKMAKEKAVRDGNAEPINGLRGATRVFIWGAAGVVAAAAVSGAYLYSNRSPQQGDFPEEAHKNAGLPPPGSIAEGAARAAAQDTAEAEPLPARTGLPELGVPARAGPIDLPDLEPASAIPGVQPISAHVTTLEEAAAKGDAIAQYEVAIGRLAVGDTPRAVAWLRRAANQGLAMAQYRLAKLYERGEGVPLDLTEARRWTERAAVAGNRKAMHDLGVYYARGEGAPFDEGQAFKWFRQAAEYGVGDSQFNLGVLYSQGRGVVADPAEAYFWFSIAATGGDSDARARAAMIEDKLGAGALAQAKARVQGFRAKSGVARANGEFGPRPWSGGASLEASAKSTPRS